MQMSFIVQSMTLKVMTTTNATPCRKAETYTKIIGRMTLRIHLNTEIKTYQDILDFTKHGYFELQGGVFLESAESLISQQNGWEDGDKDKDFDFTAAPFWITTDDDATPVPIHDVDDLKHEEASLCSDWLDRVSEMESLVKSGEQVPKARLIELVGKDAVEEAKADMQWHNSWTHGSTIVNEFKNSVEVSVCGNDYRINAEYLYMRDESEEEVETWDQLSFDPITFSISYA